MAEGFPVIVWFRRDLRLTDHPALLRALELAGEAGGTAIPVYVLSRWRGHHRWTGSNRQHFLCGCLASLDANLRAKGSRLVVRAGDAVEELLGLAREVGARRIVGHRDPDPFGWAVERRLAEKAAAEGVGVEFLTDHSVVEPESLLTGWGEPYRVFTPYSRAWRKVVTTPPVWQRAPARLPAVPEGVASLALPTLEWWQLGPAGDGVLGAGERAARERMKAFLEGPVLRYAARRDVPGEEGTSRLSQDLRFGLVSIRELVARCFEARGRADATGARSVDVFLNELIWRDFYFSILRHWPEVLEQEFNPAFRGLPWRSDAGALRRWQEGETGFPIVDAGMRQLLVTGFMHNRVRMIAAMFLTKDLHIHWREGESWFLRHLTDGEIASNNGGWQWSAGTGADAAPYFRIQNPWTQSQRHDPHGVYIRRWVPELANVPAPLLHKPPPEGTRLAPGYPEPMVDHATERSLTLEIFQQFKNRVRR